MEIIGREIAKSPRYIWLKAGSSADGACRVFTEVQEPVREKKPKGAPATADRIARELLEGVLLKSPDLKGQNITLVDWILQVKRFNANNPEWQKSDETLKDYLRSNLVGVNLVEKINTGIYRIL
jgi:hypothetical protein